MKDSARAGDTLPAFSTLDISAVEATLREIIERNQREVAALVRDEAEHPAWDTLMQPIEDLEDDLARFFAPVGHLNGVCDNETLRATYNACLPLLSEHDTWMRQNRALYEALDKLAQSEAGRKLEPAAKRALENALRDFRLAGVALAEAQRARCGSIREQLSRLQTRFSENLLDATNAWTREVTREELAGLPATALDNAARAARQSDHDCDYLLNLEFPLVRAVLTHCDNETLRREIYTANVTRASDAGPHAGQWDNTALMSEIMSLRAELAKLLGYESYAAFALARRMAENEDTVASFLQDLLRRVHPQAVREWKTLADFARVQHGRDTLQPWDVLYYSEKLRQSLYRISDEEVRPYFPVDRVLQGLFEVARRLFDVDIGEITGFDSYHPDVRLFEIRRNSEPLAYFYLDLYARPHKRGGAWMDDCRVRRYNRGQLQLPVAFLVCNFAAPAGDHPALLSTEELTTLFHEFGHGLHHMLTQQTVASVSGINGVPWDAVELPSQFLENWCWESEALAFISGHYKTGKPLPEALLQRMLEARNFQSGMHLVRQLEFALFDWNLHSEWRTDAALDIQATLDAVRKQTSVVPVAEFNRFQHSFAHIFAGGYAAGYYSYLWAEVLSADAYSRFEEEGIFNPGTGADFRRNILEDGGAREALVQFREFRGREPSVEALLRHTGIEPEQAA